MSEEVWKPVVGYEGWYEVSNIGRVRRIGGNLMKQHKTQFGYLALTLCKHGKVKGFQVHRLVAMAFVPNPQNKPFVNHLDEVKTNNRAENLEWVTSSENNNYGTAKYRTSNTLKKYFATHPNPASKPVRCIETGTIYPSMRQAGIRLGFNGKNIGRCIGNHPDQLTAGGYHWELV